MNEEGLQKTNHNKIFVGQPLDLSLEQLENMLNQLQESLLLEGDKLKEIVSEIVPTYNYQINEA